MASIRELRVECVTTYKAHKKVPGTLEGLGEDQLPIIGATAIFHAIELSDLKRNVKRLER